MQTLLVANRGAIALRIFRAARRLGLRTVAIYSEADRNAAHVADADAAFPVGPAPARESYLNIDRVLAAASEAGADLIHPGYGFLSENAEFAERVIADGITWIGPSPDTLRALGDKARARALAVRAGLPVLPGSPRFAEGELPDLATAAAVGFPLLVKASAGGGGIGMQRVDHPDKVEPMVRATQSMAAKAFGDGTVFLERFLPKARHVEIQVFGFGNGTAVHLFERDCSLQRRFQKIIEESPAPGLPESVRLRMADAAVALCRETRYAGAGTVEFIVDADSFEFFFLEVNTRLQVEHAVTEMLTGRDVVSMQIDFARKRLAFPDQACVGRSGHAIECRLYAENPDKMFLPSPGTLALFSLPNPRPDLRIESGYRTGDTVSPNYDPLLAKIIAHGSSRDAACSIAADALRSAVIEGIKTNRDFLVACLESGAFRSGDVHTGFVGEHLTSLSPGASR